MYSRILATGSYLPKKYVSNKDLEKTLDTSDEWIVQRTGIKGRHIVANGESSASMAIEACKKAMETANLEPKDIDMIICATCTSDMQFPSAACLIQEGLKIPVCPAFDVQAACSGFIYALSIADQYIKSGVYKRILIVGSEAMSKVLNWKDRTTCVLFGDGAGACILEPSKEPGILSTHLKADGSYKDLLYLNSTIKYLNQEGKINEEKIVDENIDGATSNNNDGRYVQMTGNSVFRLAVNALEQIVVETIEKNKMQPSDIDWLVPHQANIRIIQATAKKLGLSMDKVILTVEDQANTSAASIPLALDLAVRDGRIKRGQHLLLEAFGAGLTWGSALIRF